MWDVLIGLFANIGYGVFGNTILIGMFILGMFAFFLIKSGKVLADVGLIIIVATILLLSRYGFLPNWLLLISVMALGGLFFIALKIIFGSR